jgi:hypothetical protein
VKITGLYPRVRVDTSQTSAVGQAGGVLLTGTVTATGLDRLLSASLSRWRKPLAVHDPGKIITDLALSLALGGDCLADLALLRAEPGVYGRVASDPTVSRAIATLAAEAPAAGNPNGSDCACSPSPPRSPAPPGSRSCTCLTGHPGPASPSTRSTDSTSYQHPANPSHRLVPTRPAPPGPVETRPARDDNGRPVTPLRHNQPHTVILKPSQRPEAARRKIEVSSSLLAEV